MARGPGVSFHFPVRVYWEDTDAGGIVFYANYLKFFERARTEWLRAAGVEQHRLREDTGLIFVVAATSLRYAAPARLDDLLTVTVEPQPAGKASLVVRQRALRGDTLLAEGEIRIGCVRASDLKPQRLPDSVISAITA
ncbi:MULTISPECIES: tol-pal system-associated acyl-CoA thioesterase [unclassified Roseateles]|uniref:tol-pal system-associated acyl-CoA thioesterase n=1 Tax=unclassified Roseateles TaxID=2626991 RepID=UPI0006FFC4C3|nr:MULTISPECIES: tol-pal system-associated acyl-CoA thioesterase [unclassified Roseateles]KQW43583.1 4-hydroxybenzoyl-CoA thioesterase [Pelomonas sp. Root405]KRA71321.1 4-hydroxybenzoyl-CoA thioesterase [Pelomonas sp. Root662]